MSMKATKGSEHSGVMYVKASILKSYTGGISRPVTTLFVNNTPIKGYCWEKGTVLAHDSPAN